jgi:GNAT superfamily N-acetyltransferase
MQNTTNLTYLSSLNPEHIQQLHQLYQQEWWTDKRTLEETHTVVANSQIIIALVDENSTLQAFGRVLSDHIFKALIFDIIVSEKYRNQGLGKKLLSSIESHPKLTRVKHFELYCLPEMVTYYESLGFSRELGDIVFMRKDRI